MTASACSRYDDALGKIKELLAAEQPASASGHHITGAKDRG
jgi:hypothetical protein